MSKNIIDNVIEKPKTFNFSSKIIHRQDWNFLHFSHNEQNFVKVTNMSKKIFKFSDQLNLYNYNFKIGWYCGQIVILATFHAHFGASSGFKF